MTTPPPPPPSQPPEPSRPQPVPQPAHAGMPAMPALSASDRVRNAYAQRGQSDFFFEGLGMNIFLMVITCGIWGYYVFYQLMRRMRDHNLRRLEMLEGATELAWQKASDQGLAEELRPSFERIAANLQVLRAMTTDFRDPAIWLIIAIVSGIGIWIGFIFLDGDLVKHDQNEGAVEAELSAIFQRLGQNVPAPDPNRVKGKQNYAGRIVATIFTCGIYQYWWFYNQMDDANRHFQWNWPWEDALAGAVQSLSPTTA